MEALEQDNISLVGNDTPIGLLSDTKLRFRENIVKIKILTPKKDQKIEVEIPERIWKGMTYSDVLAIANATCPCRFLSTVDDNMQLRVGQLNFKPAEVDPTIATFVAD